MYNNIERLRVVQGETNESYITSALNMCGENGTLSTEIKSFLVQWSNYSLLIIILRICVRTCTWTSRERHTWEKPDFNRANYHASYRGILLVSLPNVDLMAGVMSVNIRGNFTLQHVRSVLYQCSRDYLMLLVQLTMSIEDHSQQYI